MSQILSQDLRIDASPNLPLPKKIIAPDAKKSRRSLTPVSVAPAPSGYLGTACEIPGHIAKSKKRKTGSAHRGGRWKKQKIAKRTLRGQISPKGKMYRIHNCQSALGRESTGVQILAGPNGVARFGGLQTCGSVWLCAVCADKIMRKREAEIAQALDLHIAAGFFSVMVTFTHSHKRQDRLKPMLKKYAAAMSAMASWREFKNLRASLGFVGKIRALETTWGDSAGWHPHGHELWFLEKTMTYKEAKDLERAIFPIWLKACEKFGLPKPSKEHGVSVEIALSAAQYMTTFQEKQKWGAGRELTRGHAKEAQKSEKGDRFSPFDLLEAIDVGYREEEATELFREYAHAYHGSQLLRWSEGLKARFGIGDVDDTEAATESEAPHEIAGEISRFDWYERVLPASRDLRPVILDLFEAEGMAAVHVFIAALPIVGRYGGTS